jgi:hypothetical protein
MPLGPVVRQALAAFGLQGSELADPKDTAVDTAGLGAVAGVAGAGAIVSVNDGDSGPGGPHNTLALPGPDECHHSGVFDGSVKYSVTIPTPLRVPVHLPANVVSDWKDWSLRESSQMSDKEHSLPGLRNSVVLAVKDLPFHAIPQPGENPNDCRESLSKSVTK